MVMLPNWMRFVLAILVLPCVFLTEYFLIAQWLHIIHVTYWWLVYTVLADAGNGMLVRKLIFGKATLTEV